MVEKVGKWYKGGYNEKTVAKALPTATLLIQNKGCRWYRGIANMVGV